MSSALKLAFLIDQYGPIFKGNFLNQAEQCAYIQTFMGEDHKITKNQLWKWCNLGVSRPKQGGNLHIFCLAVRDMLSMKESDEDIVRWIIDDKISILDFAHNFGVSKIDFDYNKYKEKIKKGIAFPDARKMFKIDSYLQDRKPDSHGIYTMDRYNNDPIISSSRCIIAIDRYIKNKDGYGFIFTQMYVPQPNIPKGYTEYSGMLLQPANHKYFFFESVNADIEDFVMIVTDVRTTPTNKLEGVYTSANIEGSPVPANRKILMSKIHNNVDDEKIEKSIKEHVINI